MDWLNSSQGLRVVDFRALSRSVQERFVACTTGASSPLPRLVMPPRSWPTTLGVCSIVVGLGGLIVLLVRGYGQLDRPESLHTLESLPIYAVTMGLVALGIAELLRIRAERRALPYDRGIYVFPVSIVDARESRLQVLPLSSVSEVERRGRDVRLLLVDGGVVTLRAEDDDRAEAALDAIAHGRDEAFSLGWEGRITQSFRLDPLQAPRVSSPLGSKTGLARDVPRWATHATVIGPLIGVLLAPGLLFARNTSSDDVLFARVTARGDAEAFRAYLARGGRRSLEVSQTLLPRAELRQVEKEHSVEAIDHYRATHPDAIPDEVAAARRRAMLDELARAKKPGTVAALQEFLRRHPDHGLEPEVRGAMHALFAPALVSYRQKPMRSSEVRSFVERLFAWSETKAHAGTEATTIQIRFRKRPTPSLRKADKMVAAHHWFLGETSYPSRYFDAAHAEKREKQFGALLARRVQDAFGPTVFTVEMGPRLEDAPFDGGGLPPVTEPTLFITHTEDWRGRFDGSITKPRGIWVGVGHHFEALFVIPGEARALAFVVDTPDPIPHKLIKDQPNRTISLEEELYGEMAQQAFGTFTEKLTATILPPPAHG